MKLVRYGNAGSELPGILDQEGNIRSLAAHVKDIDGPSLSTDALQKIRDIDPGTLPLVEGTPKIGSLY